MAVLILFSLSFLSLLTISLSADPNCEDLVKPLVLKDGYNSLIGKWIFSEGIANTPLLTNVLKTVNSSWMEIAPGASKDTLTLTQASMVHGDHCRIATINMTFINSTLYTSIRNITTKADLLPSCSECLSVSFSRQVNNETTRALYMLTKNTKASESELDQYWKQAVCLDFKKEPQFSYNGVTDLCQRDDGVSFEKQTKPELEKSDD